MECWQVRNLQLPFHLFVYWFCMYVSVGVSLCAHPPEILCPRSDYRSPHLEYKVIIWHIDEWMYGSPCMLFIRKNPLILTVSYIWPSQFLCQCDKYEYSMLHCFGKQCDFYRYSMLCMESLACPLVYVIFYIPMSSCLYITIVDST